MNAKAILDVLMQNGMGKSQQRLQRASRGGNPLLDAVTSMIQGGGGGSSSGGGLGGMLSQVLGGSSGGQSGSAGSGGLGDVLGSLLGGGSGSNPRQQGGVGGGLIEMLAKAAMSQMGGAATGGGQAAAPGFDVSQFPAGQIESKRNENDRALVMIRAMLTAAKADGLARDQPYHRQTRRLFPATAGRSSLRSATAMSRAGTIPVAACSAWTRGQRSCWILLQ